MAADATSATDTGPGGAGTSSTTPGMPTRRLLRGLALDVGLPLVAYYSLHALGVGNLAALLAATGVAGVRILWSAARERSLNPFATLMLVVFGVGVVLSLVSGDPRFLLLKDSITTSIVGLAFLASTAGGRPLTLIITQTLTPDRRRAELAEQYATNPLLRRGHRISSMIWGFGLLLEAAVRVPLVYLLPLPVMVGLSTVMMVTAFAVLITVNLWYIRRARARAGTGARLRQSSVRSRRKMRVVSQWTR